MTWERIALYSVTVITILSPFLMSVLPDRSCPHDSLCRGFSHFEGNAYVYQMIFAGSKADTEDDRSSTLQLYEDGKRLGPAHAGVREIVELGGGRFLYFQSGMKIGIFMSASDNSNPNTNGRIYTVKDPGALDPYKARK